MTRNRLISNIIGNKPLKRVSRRPTRMKKGSDKVHCYCNKCNGKLVLKRTKLLHEAAEAAANLPTIQEDSANKPPSPNPAEMLLDNGLRIETESQSLTESPALQVTDSLLSLPNVPRKCSRRYIMRNSEVADDTSDSDDVQHIETSLSE